MAKLLNLLQLFLTLLKLVASAQIANGMDPFESGGAASIAANAALGKATID